MITAPTIGTGKAFPHALTSAASPKKRATSGPWPCIASLSSGARKRWYIRSKGSRSRSVMLATNSLVVLVVKVGASS
eukprot:4007302-Pyramimonas_sp.AAC.1